MCFVVLFASCGRADKEAEARSEKALQEMAELGAVEYKIRKIVKVNDSKWYKVGDRKILFNCIANVKAGVDLSELTPEDIVIDRAKKSISVNLPAVKMLSINMPAEDVEVVYDAVGFFRSSFGVEERNGFLEQGQDDIVNGLENLGVFAEAEKNTEEFVKAMFMQMGYKTVNVNFKSTNKQK